MSYLSDVKSRLEDVFIQSFDQAWKDVVEPALKESYKNGVEAGRKGDAPATDVQPERPRKSWSKTRERRA